MKTADHVRGNRAIWERSSDRYQARHGSGLGGEPPWGSWRIPESELRVLGDVRDKDVLELGCGGAQWSVHLAEQGARIIGLDLARRQLEHARELIASRSVRVPVVQASAELVPFREASFDLVFSDFGAMTFGDPEHTVPEVARILRPGGLLIFSTDSPVLHLCWPDGQEHVGDRLQSDYFSLNRFGEALVEFQRPYGEWIRLFRRHRFEIEDLIEPRPAAGATSSFRSESELTWARHWPSEMIWKVRKEE